MGDDSLRFSPDAFAKVGDIIEFSSRYLTSEQADRAVGIEELDYWFSQHLPNGRVTEQERHDAIYNDKWPVREYTITGDMRMDVLHGHAIIPIKPKESQ